MNLPSLFGLIKNLKWLVTIKWLEYIILAVFSVFNDTDQNFERTTAKWIECSISVFTDVDFIEKCLIPCECRTTVVWKMIYFQGRNPGENKYFKPNMKHVRNKKKILFEQFVLFAYDYKLTYWYEGFNMPLQIW